MDWNARHGEWDANSNRRGDALRRWAQRYRWRVSAPRAPSFVTRGRSSTVDLLVHCACTVRNVVKVSGSSDGCSDHVPVVVVVPSAHPPATRRISKAARRNEVRHERAAALYEHELPRVTDELERAYSRAEMQRVYDDSPNSDRADPPRATTSRRAAGAESSGRRNSRACRSPKGALVS